LQHYSIELWRKYRHHSKVFHNNTDQEISNSKFLISNQTPNPNNKNNSLIENLETKIREQEPLRALIFDSIYDPYRGVVAYVRIFGGEIKKSDKIFLLQTKSRGEAIEVGYFSPKLFPHTPLSSGEIGYIVTGFRSVEEARVGDTITLEKNQASLPARLQKVLPIVFASIYCTEGGTIPT